MSKKSNIFEITKKDLTIAKRFYIIMEEERGIIFYTFLNLRKSNPK